MEPFNKILSPKQQPGFYYSLSFRASGNQGRAFLGGRREQILLALGKVQSLCLTHQRMDNTRVSKGQ